MKFITVQNIPGHLLLLIRRSHYKLSLHQIIFRDCSIGR